MEVTDRKLQTAFNREISRKFIRKTDNLGTSHPGLFCFPRKKDFRSYCFSFHRMKSQDSNDLKSDIIPSNYYFRPRNLWTGSVIFLTEKLGQVIYRTNRSYSNLCNFVLF